MDAFTVLLFFVYLWGFGFSVKRSFRLKSENFFEEHLMNISIGLPVFIVIGVFLNLIHIPLDWKIFLFLSVALPLFYLGKVIVSRKMPVIGFKFDKSLINIVILLILFGFSFFMYHKGAFTYPYLEDDDPWSHALGAKYVSIEKTVFVNPQAKANDIFNYIDAYPPAYDLIMGVLHQTSSNMMWTIKFFNALIISLGIIFFYFFSKSFTGSSGKALFATFALAMIPCYLSHFIWAHSLIPTLFFVVIYCLEQAKHSKNWYFIASIVIAAICLSQPVQPIKVGVLLFIYWCVKAVVQRKWQLELAGSIVLGYILSFILWWIPMFIKYGLNILSKGMHWVPEPGSSALIEKGVLGPIGSATRFYNLGDFFIAKSQNMINNPVGIGFVLSLLALIGVIFLIIRFKDFSNEKSSYRLITLFWLLFTFIGLYGGTVYPVALESFMFWMLLAIPVSLIAAEAVWLLFAVGKSVKIPKLTIIILLVVLIWFTSGQQKFAVNTAQWGPGGWLAPSPGAIYSFLWMDQNLPDNTQVFTFSLLKGFNIGFNLYSCEWCPDVISFRERMNQSSVKEIHDWIKSKGYNYAMIDEYYVKDKGVNETQNMINEMISSGLYSPVYQAEANSNKMMSFVFKVN